MSDARMASAVLVNGLVRLAQQAGGFAAVVAKGDPVSGVLVLQLLQKGRFFGLYERQIGPSGTYAWTRNESQGLEKQDLFSAYVDRRRARDPDLWVLELDIPDAERFVEESFPKS